MLEIQKIIPKNSQLLGNLHDKNFKPTIAPHSERVNDGRVLFQQNGATVDFATAVRAPICLLSVGDTALLRQTKNPEEGLTVLKTISDNSPTAAVLFDAHRNIQNNRPTLVWFAEDQFFAETAGRAIGIDGQSLSLLPLFQKQAQETRELLGQLAAKKGLKADVRMHSFSDAKVIEAIIEAINLEAIKQGLPKERKKLSQSSAAIVAVTHALFPLIESLLGNIGDQAAVQGPVHLETNPPGWLDNQELATVMKFVNQSAADWNMPHRSLLPCLFRGEPIGEFSAFDENGPQLRRDQRWKLEKWVKDNPFPLSDNPIFGHSLGLMDSPEVKVAIHRLIEIENSQTDLKEGRLLHEQLAQQVEAVLSRIKFWK